ncbi:MAG: chemotaxis response regulator protein-glutamate methylesterase [Anaerolineae bacterium]|nr:chemotaxis response regulator protein-glutamate methylesterase [Anaerolineae bacterium]
MSSIRILVVDDSAFMRLTLSRRLAAEPGFEIVGNASNGHEAVAQVRALKPDVVTMDVEMPGLDGLGALAQIMAEQPTPVIMASSLTSEGTETTVRALTLGAVDFVTKPSQIGNMQQVVVEIASKIRQAAGARVRRVAAVTKAPAGQREKMPVRPLMAADTVLAIGASTGGPGALRHLMTDLPADVNAAAVIVQHMPPGFTRSLAERLHEVSAWSVKEAGAGDRMLCGQALLAPGGFHLVLGRGGEAMLNQDPAVNNVRPAVDVTMRSVVEIYKGRVLGVVLTGMGRDGADGAALIRQAGGRVIAEAESTCAVYGMPRSVVEAGAADYVAPLPEIAMLIRRILREGKDDRYRVHSDQKASASAYRH